MNPKLTAEEMRFLRREAHGKGNLARLGFITVTAKGREFITQDDARVKQERAKGGAKGAKFGKEGGRPVQKGGRQ